MSNEFYDAWALEQAYAIVYLDKGHFHLTDEIRVIHQRINDGEITYDEAVSIIIARHQKLSKKGDGK
jgi:L-rhamnose isomerase